MIYENPSGLNLDRPLMFTKGFTWNIEGNTTLSGLEAAAA
jgi:hypothetical protein